MCPLTSNGKAFTMTQSTIASQIHKAFNIHLNLTPKITFNLVITIKRFTTAAFTMPIVNGGAGAGTLYTFPSAGKRVADFRYDGTNWVLAGVKRLA